MDRDDALPRRNSPQAWVRECHQRRRIQRRVDRTPCKQSPRSGGSGNGRQGAHTANEWSSPRKEKKMKPPTGENVVPWEQTIRVNPNGGKQGLFLKKESLGIANLKVYPNRRQTELVPRRPRENSNEDPSERQKEVISRHQQKQRGIPERESPGIFNPKYDPSGHQKEINSKFPEG